MNKFKSYLIIVSNVSLYVLCWDFTFKIKLDLRLRYGRGYNNVKLLSEGGGKLLVGSVSG